MNTDSEMTWLLLKLGEGEAARPWRRDLHDCARAATEIGRAGIGQSPGSQADRARSLARAADGHIGAAGLDSGVARNLGRNEPFQISSGR